MKVKLITYSDEKYYLAQQKLKLIAESNNIEFVGYKREDLILTDFYRENKDILDLKRGAGYWLWKPYFIYENLKNASTDEIILYMDCADIFMNGFLNFLRQKINLSEFFLIKGQFVNSSYTKRDCFILMDCDEEKYWNSIQLEAGICAFKKTEKSLNFVSEWLNYAKNRNILTDDSNITKENLNGFIDHRHDQSIISLLSIKYGITPVENSVRLYIMCNVNQ
jgi:hypothetical protein